MDAPRAGTDARRALSASGCQDVHRTERHAHHSVKSRQVASELIRKKIVIIISSERKPMR